MYKRQGAPPPVDLAAERRHGDLVRGLIHDGLVATVHDLSDGGLIAAAAEMALSSDVGLWLETQTALPHHAWLFGEDQGRYLLAVAPARESEVLARAAAAGAPAALVGDAGGTAFAVKDLFELPLAELRAVNEAWMPAFMGA